MTSVPAKCTKASNNSHLHWSEVFHWYVRATGIKDRREVIYAYTILYIYIIFTITNKASFVILM